MKSVVLVFVFVVSFVGVIVNADDPGCNVVPMSQWAGEASLRKETLPNPVKKVIIQHTALTEPTEDAECVKALKDIRTLHREKMGFDDIGESFLICGNGKVYEGAGWGLVGAHTKSYNSKSIGISFMGDFGSHLPNAKALAAAKDLIACGVKNNHLTADYKLVGHRQVSATISPGDALETEIKTWPDWSAMEANPS